MCVEDETERTTPSHATEINNRQATFFAEEDYCFYLERLGEGARKCACSIHAYVLMTNHGQTMGSESFL
jgi:REP element-mobilizing transposase RayT